MMRSVRHGDVSRMVWCNCIGAAECKARQAAAPSSTSLTGPMLMQ